MARLGRPGHGQNLVRQQCRRVGRPPGRSQVPLQCHGHARNLEVAQGGPHHQTSGQGRDAALEGGLEKAAIRYFALQGEKILRSKIGRSDRGIDVASYIGQGTGARLIISESKNLGGLVPGKSLTALGSGKQGVNRVNLRRLESNLAAIRRSIENQVQDPTTRQTLLAQLDPGSQTGPILRLVGNTAKGTTFNESDIQEIVRDISGVVKFQWPPVILNLTVPK